MSSTYRSRSNGAPPWPVPSACPDPDRDISSGIGRYIRVRIELATTKSKRPEELVDMLIPQSGGLLQSIETSSVCNPRFIRGSDSLRHGHIHISINLRTSNYDTSVRGRTEVLPQENQDNSKKEAQPRTAAGGRIIDYPESPEGDLDLLRSNRMVSLVCRKLNQLLVSLGRL